MSTLDRRQRQRYCIHFDVQFAVVKRGKTVCIGSGIIRDVSSDGMFFEPNEVCFPELGSVIHLIAKWPVRCDGTICIEWIVSGIVVRGDTRGVAVAIMKEHLERRAQNTAREHWG